MKQRFFSTAVLALLIAALPLAATAEEPTSRPATEGELMNETCPFTGKPAVSDRFVEYADKDAGVYARVYFCCEKCQGKASKMDQAALKPVYAKAYLADIADYGKASLIVENEHCPVTGNPADGSTTMNYNGARINLCCPGCDEQVIGQPDKNLHNLNNDIDAARKAKEEEEKSAG
jgi:hypothetical protein